MCAEIGYKAYVHIELRDEDQQGQVDPTVELGRLIGYRVSYLAITIVLDGEGAKVGISRKVTLLE